MMTQRYPYLKEEQADAIASFRSLAAIQRADRARSLRSPNKARWRVFITLAVLSASSAPCVDTDIATAKPARNIHHRHSGEVQKGVASFYSPKAAGKPTASGRPLVLNHMTAASPTLPLGTKAKVVNTESGKSAHVTITDRGPYAKGRVIDVTPKAAEQLGMKKKGVAPVEVKPVSKPSSPKNSRTQAKRDVVRGAPTR